MIRDGTLRHHFLCYSARSFRVIKVQKESTHVPVSWRGKIPIALEECHFPSEKSLDIELKAVEGG